MLKAVANVNDVLAPKLLGLDVTDQSKIDKLMVEESLAQAQKQALTHKTLQARPLQSRHT